MNILAYRLKRVNPGTSEFPINVNISDIFRFLVDAGMFGML